MGKWAFILLIALLGASCGSILNSKPSGTLSEKKMTDVLVDIHLTEATMKIGNDSLARINDTTQIRQRFAEVFIKNDIDPDDFNTSLDYYLKHIEALDKIYVEVINRLTELDATLQPKPVQSASSFNSRKNINNFWFKLMNKTDEPEKIQYFSPLKYPVEEKVNYPEPLNKSTL
jgi:hypothetical protein